MSADNGVYILHCEDICKIKELKAVGNLFGFNGKPDPIRIYYAFRDADEASDMNGATILAEKLLESIDYCENGIQIIPAEKSWTYFEAKHKQYIRRRNASGNQGRKHSRINKAAE